MTKKIKIINIETKDEEFEIEVKRFYFPVKINWKCPNGHINVRDFEEDYISYPLVNKEMNFDFYCQECDEEGIEDPVYETNLKIKINIEITQPK